MKPRILATRRWQDGGEHFLESRFDVTLNRNDTPLTQAERCEAPRVYDALLCFGEKRKLPADFVPSCADPVPV
ncbi:hypothetical protein JJB09_20040 [Rhizobium sp. KVB221]|uniref:Uncharacterized protein n=1 Tax=Rhizobium setariae TaxID=2801340 RepID=A0A937CRC4_9HYPH|nr:hypothetical protein [Rhizobium setariae]MBL0374317.1 hypothetical protein [Rhizobium setariae]